LVAVHFEPSPYSSLRTYSMPLRLQSSGGSFAERRSANTHFFVSMPDISGERERSDDQRYLSHRDLLEQSTLNTFIDMLSTP
jgi:hypothetical protein